MSSLRRRRACCGGEGRGEGEGEGEDVGEGRRLDMTSFDRWEILYLRGCMRDYAVRVNTIVHTRRDMDTFHFEIRALYVKLNGSSS
jgi:hypothetical protein